MLEILTNLTGYFAVIVATFEHFEESVGDRYFVTFVGDFACFSEETDERSGIVGGGDIAVLEPFAIKADSCFEKDVVLLSG